MGGRPFGTGVHHRAGARTVRDDIEGYYLRRFNTAELAAGARGGGRGAGRRTDRPPPPLHTSYSGSGGRESVGSVPYRRSSGSRRSPHMSAGSRSAVGLSARSGTSRQPTAPVRGSAASALPRIAPYSASPHRRAALSARFCTVWGAFRSLFDHQTGHFSPPFRRPPAARRADCRLYRASVRAVGLQSGSRGPPPRRARVRIAAKLVFCLRNGAAGQASTYALGFPVNRPGDARHAAQLGAEHG